MSDSEQDIREDDGDEDNEVDPAAHKKLLQAIGKLSRNQHIRKPTRSEPALARDEFHLVKPLSTEVQTVSMGDVVGLLKKTSGHLKAGKELSKSQQHKKVLKKPLEKPVAERIQRTIGYEKAKKSLSRWDAIVERNRVAEQQVFPLDYEEVHVALPTRKKPRGTTIKSDLMLEMEAVESKLRSLKNANQTQEKHDEKKIQEKLTRDELIARRKELAYLRARESQKSARARLQNKIKSKKYHKLLKREKLKEQIKEFELLQKTNPEAALEKLESIEKNRVLERASLRHRNTGTWAKNLQIRAKYDKDVRKDLSEQLALSRELTQKQEADEDSESGEDAEEAHNKVDGGNHDPSNPWFQGKKKLEQANEIMEYMSGYRKYWTERNKNEQTLKEFRSETNESMDNDKQNVTSPAKKLNSQTKSKTKTINMKTKNPMMSDEEINSESELAPGSTKGDSESNELCSGSALEEFKAILNNSEKDNKIKKNRKRIKTPKSEIKPKINGTKNIEKRAKKALAKVKKPKSLKSSSKLKISRKRTTSDADIDDPEDIANANLDIDDIFDDAENHLQKKVVEKIAALNVDLNSEKSNKNKKKKNSSKRKQNSTDLSFKVQPSRPEIDEELLETPANETIPEQNRNTHRLAGSKIKPRPSTENGIDPNNIAQIKPKMLRTALPDMVNSEEFFDEHEAESKVQMTIAEAFEDDDIVADFEQDRDEERKKSSNTDVDLTLPGWGSWAGCGISKPKKTKKLILKFPKDAPRRDDCKQNVYINESGNKSVKHHLVSDLPFPFKSVQEYEASIRAPTGRSFVPETAFRMLTRPAIVTKLGAVIEPMSDEHLMKMPKRPRTIVDKRIHKMNKNKQKQK